ncbi:MAG TPA: lysylphosphatidylglycerol synthase domain-containing protein [Puia sp.]
MSKNIKLIVNYVAGPIIMLILFYAVVRQLQKQPHWKESLHQMLKAATGKQQWKLYCMFGLMWVNWALETCKWKIAMKSVQSIKFLRAFKAILAGTAIAAFTPNRVGEYLGRMLFVDQGNKVLSITPAIVCSMSQMLVTLIAGTAGLQLFSLLSFQIQISWLSSVFIRASMGVTAVAAICLGLVYFRFGPLVIWVNKWLKQKKKNFSVPQNFSLLTLISVLILSMLRYLVFILQYSLLFSLFGIPLSGMQLFTGVSVMFILMAIVPTLTFLTDLGFRWIAGVQIFQVFTTNTAGILAVSLGIWLINLIIPALVGSLLILRIKLFSSR